VFTREIDTAMLRILLALSLALGAAPVFAQGDVNGKHSLTKLFQEAAAPAAGSTVRIRCDSKDAVLGTIVDAKGLILTKGSEVLTPESKTEWKPKGSLSVKLRDGSEYDAEYVGYHEKSDLVLLKIDAPDLVPVKFVEAKKAEAGNMVAAPGLDSEPVAAGIVSAGVRKLYRDEAAIRNGNKGYLGIMRDITREDGVYVDKYSDEQANTSPAKKAGIRAGDQIIRLADRDISRFEDLTTALDKYKPGDKVTIVVKRKAKDEDTEELTFELNSPAAPPSTAAKCRTRWAAPSPAAAPAFRR